ncbi:hypothetical protein [Bacillus sp. SJS]|uniref:hypothetical protein n=1 Tax=Bacillus sp. SJS TaxID=1423321 RepID=UPI0004DCBDF0|nr:hypothetical protein [Bacillus sp. SJS]KZZ82523.1 hypothetical protein AS29_020750 [Bacillus sp. SJS]
MNIEQAREGIKQLERYIALVEGYQVKSLETAVIKIYAERQNVADVAVTLNEQGYRIDGRKVVTSDVSGILRNKPKDELSEIVHKWFKSNQKKVNVFI